MNDTKHKYNMVWCGSHNGRTNWIKINELIEYAAKDTSIVACCPLCNKNLFWLKKEKEDD